MHFKRLAKSAAFLAMAVVGGLVGSWIVRPDVPEAGPLFGPAASGIAATFGVGGILSADGQLWQYRLDKKKWVKLDESFKLESQNTNIEPLPIPVSEIQHLETFGFIVAEDGTCWLYNIKNQKWEDIGAPPLGK